jgi:acyl-CoA thioesterase-1
MLRAAGYDVVVKNEGTNGQTTLDELGKLDAIVPDGVKIVIFQPGGNDNNNPSRTPVGDTGSNKLLDRNIRVVFSAGRDQRQYVEDLDIIKVGPLRRFVPETEWQADKAHLTPEGYKMVAARMYLIVRKLLDQISKQQ